MDNSLIGFVELFGVFGLALGWAVFELISVRREIRRDRERQLARNEPEQKI